MIYICGDSFCVSDPEYGPNWADLLAQRFDTVNLGQVAATNLLIARQVDQALAAGAEFVIVQGTAVTRDQKRVGNSYQPFSYHTAGPETTPFDHRQLRILREYFTEFFDLDLAVYENQIIIEHTLQKLVDSGRPFRFDQGGFEHPRFGNSHTGYFAKYAAYRSEINLWDYTVSSNYRPYYHITDPGVHARVADYYTEQIQKQL